MIRKILGALAAMAIVVPAFAQPYAPLSVPQGGTGLNTNPVNGALLIGNGSTFTEATLTAGSNITITNSAGGITIAATGGSGGGVSSVTNSDGTLTFTTTSGAVVGSLNLGNANTWTAAQTFSGVLNLTGSTGLEQNGTTVLYQSSATNGALAIGAGAGGAWTNSTTLGLAVGNGALPVATGASNTCGGTLTGNLIVTGVQNTCWGDQVMRYTGTSIQNTTGVGAFSFEGTSANPYTGARGTGVGVGTGQNCSSCTELTATGAFAGAGVSGTPLTGSSNTLTGAYAGYQLQGNAGNNTLTGDATGKAVTTGGTLTETGSLVGSTVEATGIGVVLAGFSQYCDTPATNTSNVVEICGEWGPVWSATATNTPGASITNFSGNIVIDAEAMTATQATGGTIYLPLFTTYGITAGQLVTGPSGVPSGDTVSAVTSVQFAVRFKTTGASNSGQQVITYSGANSAAEVANMQCVDLTAPGSLGNGNLISSVTTGTSITMVNNIVTTIAQGDLIACYPTVALTSTTTSAIASGALIGFYTQHTALSQASALADMGDASIYGNTILGNLVFMTGIGSDTGQSDSTLCRVASNGEVYYGSGTGGICLTTSTMRFKTDIRDEAEGLPQIMALHPVGFNYKPGHGYDPSHRYNGFLAEDMDQVLPRLVGHDEEGRPNSVDLMGLVPILVRTVQQQQAEIDELKARWH